MTVHSNSKSNFKISHHGSQKLTRKKPFNCARARQWSDLLKKERKIKCIVINTPPTHSIQEPADVDILGTASALSAGGGTNAALCRLHLNNKIFVCLSKLTHPKKHEHALHHQFTISYFSHQYQESVFSWRLLGYCHSKTFHFWVTNSN